MCDYSLDHVASRPARVGDKLVTTTFANSITRGFAAMEEPTVAVCLLPARSSRSKMKWNTPLRLGPSSRTERLGKKWLGSGRSTTTSRT